MEQDQALALTVIETPEGLRFLWVNRCGMSENRITFERVIAPRCCVHENTEVWRGGKMIATGVLKDVGQAMPFPAFSGLEGVFPASSGDREELRAEEFRKGDELVFRPFKDKHPLADFPRRLVAGFLAMDADPQLYR